MPSCCAALAARRRKYVEVPTPVPGEGKVLVKADTIGVSKPVLGSSKA